MSNIHPAARGQLNMRIERWRKLKWLRAAAAEGVCLTEFVRRAVDERTARFVSMPRLVVRSMPVSA